MHSSWKLFHCITYYNICLSSGRVVTVVLNQLEFDPNYRPTKYVEYEEVA
jgi:hypothetical protein